MPTTSEDLYTLLVEAELAHTLYEEQLRRAKQLPLFDPNHLQWVAAYMAARMTDPLGLAS